MCGIHVGSLNMKQFSYPTWSKHWIFLNQCSHHCWWRPFRIFVPMDWRPKRDLLSESFGGADLAQVKRRCIFSVWPLVKRFNSPRFKKHLGRIPCVTALRTCLEQAAAVSQASEKSENSEDIAMVLAQQLPAASLLSYLVIKRGWNIPENNWENDHNDLSFGIFRATMIDMIDYSRVSTFLTQLFSCRRWHSSSCWGWSFVWLFPRMAHDLCCSISPVSVNCVKSLYMSLP